MEVEFCEKIHKKKANWATLGGIPLPIVNPNAFTNGEIKLAKVRPKLVVDVPTNEDEKRVKVSRIPVVLKYLKNNWIWHSKNGLEKSSAGSGKTEERQNAAEIDARAQMRYRRFQSALRNAANAEQQNGQNGEETEGDAAALQLLEEQSQIRRLRRDLVKQEIEREEANMGEGPSTSMESAELATKSLERKEVGRKEMERPTGSKIVSMAARAMGEDEPMELEKAVKWPISGPSHHHQHCSSSPSSSSSSAPVIIRRGKGSGGGRMRRMPMDEKEDEDEDEDKKEEEEMDAQNGKREFGNGNGGNQRRGPHSPPPAKLGRNN